MKKPKPDSWIEAMLRDEYRQSLDVLNSLKRKLEEYPRGSLGIRKRINKKTLKVYEYPCLKYSENNKIFNVHVPWSKLSELHKRVEARNKIVIQIKSYQSRVQQLEKILGMSRSRKKSSQDSAP